MMSEVWLIIYFFIYILGGIILNLQKSGKDSTESSYKPLTKLPWLLIFM